MIHISENKLSPSEKEDEKVDHLINKETPHSRKYVNKRGPKHDNRKRRITEDDKDMNIKTVEGDRDMSLNYKYSSHDIVSFIAVQIASELKKLESAVKAYDRDLRKSSPIVADEFSEYAATHYIEPAEEGNSDYEDDGINDVKSKQTVYNQLLKSIVKYLPQASPEGIVGMIGSTWPNGDKYDFASRAAVIGGLHKAIDKIPLPQSLKIPFLRKNVKEFVNDKEFIKRILESSKVARGAKLDEKVVPRFAQLAAAYQIVQSNPSTIDPGSMSSGVEALSDNITAQFEELSALNMIMADWHDTIKQIRHEKTQPAELGHSSNDYDKIVSSIEKFFKGDHKLIDVAPYIDEMKQYANKFYGGMPDQLTKAFQDIEVDFDPDVNPEGKPVSFDSDDEPAKEPEEINPESKSVNFDSAEDPVEVDAKPILEGEDLEKVVQHYIDLLMDAVQDQDTKAINKFLRELHNEVSGSLEEDIAKIAARIIATSNERMFNRNMTIKSAAYHGVVDQRGNPTDPINTGYKSYDKRYFEKGHYDSIIKVAKDMLKDEWLQSGWEKGATDAPLRAALDLAIHTADGSLYQGKVDAETYNYLLNKLAGWGYDTFSDTLLSFKKDSRSASMKPEHKAMIKIANDIRHQNPLDSIAILKNVRSLLAGYVDLSDLDAAQKDYDASEDAADDADKEADNMFGKKDQNKDGKKVSSPVNDQVSGDVTKGEFPPLHDEIQFKSMDDSDFDKVRKEVEKSLKPQFDSKDIDDFMSGFDDLLGGLQKKVGTQVVIPLGTLIRFAHNNAEARKVLLPLILQYRDSHIAKIKKSKKKAPPKNGVKEEKVSQKKEEKPDPKDKKGLPKNLKDLKKSKSKKASLSAEDLDW